MTRLSKVLVVLVIVLVGLVAALLLRSDPEHAQSIYNASTDTDLVLRGRTNRSDVDATNSLGNDPADHRRTARRTALRQSDVDNGTSGQSTTAPPPSDTVVSSKPAPSISPLHTKKTKLDVPVASAEHALTNPSNSDGTMLSATELLATNGNPPRTSDQIEHRIVAGDNLRELSQRYLGDPRFYIEIYELNRELLVRPDLLPVGKVIVIPTHAR